MIKSYTLSSNKKGPKVAILGSIHGDEKCGTKAINKIMTKIDNGDLKIKKGTITFIPICNPKAYSLNKRYYQENLNRIIRKHKETRSYEEKLANILIEYIQKNDYILDIHSMKSNGVPFVFQDYNMGEDKLFCRNIGLKNIVTGWPNLYIEENNGDTVGYAHSIGKIGAVVECGNHEDPEAENVAYTAILNTLNGLGMIEEGGKRSSTFNFIEVKKLIKKEKEGVLVKKRNHMDEIKKGEAIARYTNGEVVSAENDGYILLPKDGASNNEERFYLGE